MSTTMIEFYSFDEKAMTKTTFAPFAWFYWPMEILGLVLATIRNTATATTDGRYLKRTGGKVKAVRVERGGLTDLARHTVLETCALSPVRVTTEYVAVEDFEAASKLL